MWNNYIITNAGLNLIARSQVEEKTLTMTKGKTSSKAYTVEQLPLLNDLENIEQEVNINEKKSNQNNINIRIDFTNELVVSPYNLKTIGMYGKLGSEEEVLIFVAINNENEQVPSHSQEIWETIFNIDIPLSNTSNITVNVDYAAQATQEFVMDKIEENYYPRKIYYVTLPTDTAEYETITDTESQVYYKYTYENVEVKNGFAMYDIYLENISILSNIESMQDAFYEIIRVNCIDEAIEVFIKSIPTTSFQIKVAQ